MSFQQDPQSILRSPIVTGDEFICSCREDTPEIVVVHGPGLNVVRVNADVQSPQDPLDRFNVPGSELSHFYDGFLSQGNVYFLSASPDGNLDYTRVHVLSLLNKGQIVTRYCEQDPQHGMPAPRKQAALDSISGFILLAGGEIDYGGGNVTRLVDYWILDVTNFKWTQLPAQMPIPLIEPRLTTASSGNVYLWGDYDEPLPGMPADGTHVRIIRIIGFNTLSPPSYNQALSGYGVPSAPQQQGGYPPQQGGYPPQQGGYPPQQGGYPPQQGGYIPQQGGYPPQQAGYPPQQGGYPPQQEGYPSQQAGYPPQQEGYPSQQGDGGQYAYYPSNSKKKDCIIC